MTIDADDREPTLVDNQSAAAPSFVGFRRFVALAASVICLVLATLGFFLPVLPSTPFVLLASILLVRSSPSMHRRLRSSRFFGRILTDWEVRKGVRRKDKVRAIFVVVAGFSLTLYFGKLSIPLRVLATSLVCIGILVIVRLPIAVDSAADEQRPRP